jgi:hypothetical protein
MAVVVVSVLPVAAALVALVLPVAVVLLDKDFRVALVKAFLVVLVVLLAL